MPAEPQIVMVRVTDVFGNVEEEPLVVLVQGSAVTLECSGLSMVGFVDELRETLEPKRDIREAAA